MEYEEFKKRLKDIGLSVKEFANLSGVGYGTCSSWARPNRKVSAWVESWLKLYLESQEYKKYKESIQILMSGINTNKQPTSSMK